MEDVKQYSRKKKFIKDFGIYAIGNLGSKLITFLMIPLYTYFVEKPSDYGYFDLCLQVCFLMFPVITLQLRDGSFRFLLDTHDTNERSRIITFAYRTLGITIISTIVVAFCLSLFVHIDYLWSTIAVLVVMSAYEFLAQISRGLGNNKAFIEGMGGYSIYASSLDGSDKCVRLEAYMADEHGGKDGWKIEKCYVKDDSNREMLDIIAGKFFIAYAPIESEKFLSMPKELARKYEEKFKYPERFYKSLDGIEAKPYKPVSKDMER